jgi:hypothetical protein
MASEKQLFAPQEFLAKLQGGEISRPVVFTGMVKKSEDDSDYLLFARGNKCTNWIKIPLSSIEKIDLLNIVACKDHTHPLVTLYLYRPQTEEGLLFLSLAQAPSSPTSRVASAPLVRRRVERRSSGYPNTSRSQVRADPGCNDVEIDEDGTTWCFVESSEHYYIYEQC